MPDFLAWMLNWASGFAVGFELSTGVWVRTKTLLNNYFLIVSVYPTSQSDMVG